MAMTGMAMTGLFVRGAGLVALVVVVTALPAPALAAGDAGDRSTVTVERVTDGDTIRVSGGDFDDESVRLIGIDTPEVDGPYTDAECFGVKSSARARTLMPEGSEVELVLDAQERDRFGRVLAYVYRASDGRFVNAAMVRGGFATAITIPPNVVHADRFRQLERDARDAGRGLWGACERS
jgi:micrococcal nuclease